MAMAALALRVAQIVDVSSARICVLSAQWCPSKCASRAGVLMNLCEQRFEPGVMRVTFLVLVQAENFQAAQRAKPPPAIQDVK